MTVRKLLTIDHAGLASRARFAPAAIMLVAVGCIAYANSFYGVFLFDDHPNIVENLSLRSWHAAWNATGSEIPLGLWNRPLGRFSFALNYAISGLDPWSYHFLNLLIHLIAALILLDLIRRTLRLHGTPRWLQENSQVIALSTVLLWAVHPLQTESVTYVVQRLESLMGLFYIACVYCLLRGSRSSNCWVWYVAAIATCWAGALTKEVMVTAPVVALLYDRIFLSRSWVQVVRRRGWIHASMLFSSLYLVWASRKLPFVPRPVARPSSPKPFHDYTDAWHYLLSQPAVLLHYLKLSFWPRGQCLDYMWPVANSWMDVVPPGIVIVSLLATCCAGLWFRPRIGFVGFASFLVLAPTSTFIPLRLAFEHRMYLSLAGLSLLSVLAVTAALHHWTNNSKLRQQIGVSMLFAVVALLTCATYLRNTAYYSRLAMFQDNIIKAPENIFAYINLGDHYLEVHDPGSALALFQAAAKIKPDDARPWACIGCALKELGDLHQAAVILQRAVDMNPKHALAQHHLAVALEQLDRWDEAVKHFEIAIHLSSGDATIRNDFAVALASRSEFALAEMLLRQALSINPEHAQAHTNLGSIIMSQNGSRAEAIKHFREACRLDPDGQEPQQNLRRVLAISPQ